MGVKVEEVQGSKGKGPASKAPTANRTSQQQSFASAAVPMPASAALPAAVEER